MRRILITGVNGFVGSALAEHFKDDYVVGIGRRPSNDKASAYYAWDIRKWDDEIANTIVEMDNQVDCAHFYQQCG